MCSVGYSWLFPTWMQVRTHVLIRGGADMLPLVLCHHAARRTRLASTWKSVALLTRASAAPWRDSRASPLRTTSSMFLTMISFVASTSPCRKIPSFKTFLLFTHNQYLDIGHFDPSVVDLQLPADFHRPVGLDPVLALV